MQRRAAGKVVAALTTVTAVGRGEGRQADADVVATDARRLTDRAH